MKTGWMFKLRLGRKKSSTSKCLLRKERERSVDNSKNVGMSREKGADSQLRLMFWP